MTVVILKLNDERKKKILVMYIYCDLVADKNDE